MENKSPDGLGSGEEAQGHSHWSSKCSVPEHSEHKVLLPAWTNCQNLINNYHKKYYK
jgi:hypothetical protein